MSPELTRGIFVTGTDTDVGKTLIAAALVRCHNAAGMRCVGMKPVAAGATWQPATQSWHNEDVAALRAASPIAVLPELQCPYLFEPAIAPHVAAREAGVPIDQWHIVDCFQRLQDSTGNATVVVEGAGGWMVPTDDHHRTLADLAVALHLPIVMVVGLRLGCISHALLTERAIAACGLKLVGWVGNMVDPGMDHLEHTIDTLRQCLPAPCLGLVPWLPGADSAQAATYLHWPPG